MKLFKISVIVLSFFVSLWLLKSPGTGDVENWLNIIRKIRTTSNDRLFPNCLNYDCGVFYPLTYPPGHFLIVYFFAKVLPANVNDFMTFKISVLVFYWLTFLSILFFYYQILSKKKNRLPFINLLLLYLSAVSILINSQVFGYTDVYFLPFIILSLTLIYTEKFFPAGFFYGISFLIKWQPFIILPVILLYLHLNKKSVIKFLTGILISIVLLLPLNPKIFQALIYSFVYGAALNNILSNAFNLQWISGFFYRNFFPDIFGGLINGSLYYLDFRKLEQYRVLFTFPKYIFLLIYLIIILRKLKQKSFIFRQFLYVSLIAYSAYFFISSGVHENHLILAVVLALMLYISDSSVKAKIVLRYYDFVNLINLTYFSYVFFYLPAGNFVVSYYFSVPASIILSVIYVITLMAYLKSA